ncbi:YozE family protein [Amnibacterium flavum]|uniref:YozE SAM-like domain-containing protein n=1 Tax=Amnibacterium flavum TaxID=2173173 RepID=A0A2V1HPM0_9MICO|nr:YozE family protein [Amnibacterium flavum]PVZ94475.1 hypothetical protein DDQ50_12270 [Amnibacterium flavum]
MTATATFPHWLSEQKGRDDEVGAFAADIAAAGDFPDSGGKPIFDGYFENASPEEKARYDRAWSEFTASAQPSPTSDRPEGFGG